MLEAAWGLLALGAALALSRLAMLWTTGYEWIGKWLLGGAIFCGVCSAYCFYKAARNRAMEKPKDETIGLDVNSPMEIDSSGGGTGADIDVTAQPGQGATGVRVSGAAPGGMLKVIQRGVGTGLKVVLRIGDKPK